MSKRHFLEFEQPIAELDSKIEELRYVQNESAVDISEEIERLGRKSQQLTKEIYASLSPWQVTQIARHPQRPYTLDYVSEVFTDFHELHGDRALRRRPVDRRRPGALQRPARAWCSATRRAATPRSVRSRNFGMARPEGYRKALRLMKLAEKFGLPVFTFVDTPGAYPGIGAEERGQSEAIGRNIFEMAQLEVPIVTTIIGEGGSGGALAHQRRRPGADAAVRGVLGHLARRLRVDPVEDRRTRVRRRRRAGHHRAPAEGAGRDRQDRQRAGRRRAPRSRSR